MKRISETGEEYDIRPARPDDLPELMGMVRELAEFERLTHQVTATEEDFRESLFGARPVAEALIGEAGSGAVGYAIFFTTFSTFLGKSGIWLEDLYVKPEYRGRGLGKALLRAVGGIAQERGAGRYEWTVLDWNRAAINLYERSGGEILPDWRIVRMDRERLHHLMDT